MEEAALAHTTRVKKTIMRKALVVLVLFALQFWLWNFAEEQASEFRGAQMQKQQVTDLRQRVQDAETSFQSHESAFDRLAAVVPTDDSVLGILERLETVAVERGVVLTLEAITREAVLIQQNGENVPFVDPPPGTVGLTPLVISLTATGGESQLLGYLDAIEHVQELTTVRSFVLTPGSLEAHVVFYLQTRN